MSWKNKNLLTLSILTFIFCAFSLLTGTVSATTGVNPDISFEGKIVNSSGVNITNATYNVEFTMYTGCTNEPTNNTGCTLAWTEDYLTSASEGIAMSGGTFEANLGQYCTFAGSTCQGNTNTGINWNTYPIYMSMQIGGTANCSSSPAGGLFTANCAGDGVMQPYILMTSTPYAQNAGTLGNIASSGFAQLAIGSQTFTGSNTFEDSTNSATAFQVDTNGAKSILGVDTSGDQVVFGNTTTNVGQVVFDDGNTANTITINAANSSATYSLTLPTVTPSTSQCLQTGAVTYYLLVFSTCGSAGINNGFTLQSSASFDIQSTSGHVTGVLEANGADTLDLKNSSAVTVESFGSTGAAVFENSTNSTTAFQVQNASAANILNVDTTASSVNINGLSAPGTVSTTLAPTISNTTTFGTAGTTTYTYEVVAAGPNGSFTYPSPHSANTAFGNATLSGSNYNIVNWGAVTGATNYYVYRTADGTTATAIGLIGVVPSGTTLLHDTGLAVTGTVPALTGGLPGTSTAYYFKVTAIDGTGGQTTASAETSSITETTTTNNAIDLSWAPETGARGYDVYYATSSGAETNGFFTTYTNSYEFTTTTGTTAGSIPTVSTAYNNTLSTSGNSQVTIGNTAGSASTAQLDVAGNVPTAVTGTVATGTNPYSVYVQGSYAYVATYNNLLQVVDISNPANPVVVGSVATTGSESESVYVQGSYAYVTNKLPGSLQIFNISNPSNPVSVNGAGTATGSFPDSVYVEGNYAYITDSGSSTFQVFNVSNPAVPVSVANVSAGANDDAVYVQGNYAYVGNYTTPSLQIFNISNPASPVSVGSVTTGAAPDSIYVQGNYAYVVNYTAGTLQIINVTNPASPVSVSTINTGTNPLSVYVEGRYAYVANYGSGTLQIFDVSNPANPAQLGSNITTGTNPTSVYVSGRYAYVTSSGASSLQVFDLGGAYVQQLQAGGAEVGTLLVDTNAQVAGNQSIVGGLSVGGSTELSGNLGSSGSALFENTTNSTTALQVQNASGVAVLTVDTTNSRVDIGSDGTATSQLYVGGSVPAGTIGAISTGASSNPSGLAVQGRYAYVANYGTNTFQVYDVSNPASPVQVSSTSTGAGTGPTAVAVAGHYAYVLNFNTNQLQTWDISNPKVPVGEDTVYTGTFPDYIYVQGRYAYVTNYSSNTLQIFDLANPSAPVLSSSVSTGSIPIAVYVQGRYAYVVNTGSNSLQIFDVFNPNLPAILMSTTTTGTDPNAVYVQNNYAYVVNEGSSSMQIFNVSNPSSVPAALGTFTTSSAPDAIYVQGRTAYLAEDSNSVQTVDVSNPASPQNVGTVGSGTGDVVQENSAEIITAEGRYVYTLSTNTSNNLQIYDVGGSYVQQLEAGGIETSTLNVDSDADIAGDTTIGGGLQVGQSEQVDGNLGVNGSVSITGEEPTGTTGSVTTGGGSDDYVSGNYAYVVNAYNATMQIYDISIPASPTLISTTATDSQPTNVFVAGRYAYVTDYGSASFQIFDVINPSSPVLLSETFPGINYIDAIYVQGHYAYVEDANTPSYLMIYDISNPSAPVAISSTYTFSNATSVYVSGSYAYVTSYGTNELFVINISNPANPIITDSVTPSNNPNDVYVQGNYAYVADNSALQIFDVSNPSQVVQASIYYIVPGANLYGIVVQGDYAYVQAGASDDDLLIFNVTNPATTPTLDGGVATGAVTSRPTSLAVQGGYAYVPEDSGMQIFNLGGAYIQQLQVGAVQVGSLSISNNAQVAGDESIAGGLTVGSSAQVAGNISAGGLNIIGGLASPTTPTETITCSGTCASSYTYLVQAYNNSGNSTPSPTVSTAVANATLNTTTEYNETSWSAVTGATSYNVYRTAGGTQQGLVGTVLYTKAETPSSGSETGATLTLNFTSPPPWSPGQGITLASFTTSAVDGTWPILSVTATSITVNILGGSTRAITVGPGTATGALAFYDTNTNMEVGYTAATTATAGTISLQTNSTKAFFVGSASAVANLTVDTQDAIVMIGSNNSANTTQTLLQLNSDATFTEAASCSTSTNQGALYYNNAANNIRACINGSWQDLVSTQDLALQLFGVVPNSGPSPGDLIGASATATANTGSPCEVSFDNSLNTSVYINSCQAYSGGREVNWAGGAIAAPTGIHTYQNVCFNSSGVPALEGSSSTTWGSQSFNNLTITNSTTDGQPLLCLATIETGATTGNMSGGNIYDTRTFTTTEKEYVSMASATAGILGGLVGPSATAGQQTVTPVTTQTTAVTGVVIASADTAEATAGVTNVVIAFAGPQWILASSATLNDLVTPGGATNAGMALAGTTTGTFAYNMIGINLNTYGSGTCGTALYGTTDCQTSVFTYMEIQ